jgi:large subunit ribosomal protein L21
MFAVIKTGGKQYRVVENDVLLVEKLAGAAGDKIQFDDVLLIGGDGVPKLGVPRLEKAAVFGDIIEQTRGDKVLVFKKRRRQGYRRKRGHQQLLTAVRIVEISTSGTRTKEAAKPAKKEKAKAEAKAADEAAPKKTKAKSPAKPRAKAKTKPKE